MPPSYRRIDYRLRPAKSIERKMLAEAFRRLSEFGEVSGYRYVGLGSLYFSDFVLFHRALGFQSMVSIENTLDSVQQSRFKLNLPFGNIDIRFGHSNVELPKLNWYTRSIVWLDYDGSLDKSVLIDIDYVTRHAAPGSLLLISVNAGDVRDYEESEESPDGQVLSLVDVLKTRIGVEAVPLDLKASDLSGWGVADAYRKIVDSKILDSLLTRNVAVPTAAQVKYKQLFNFHYSDNAKMLTLGGILYDAGQSSILAKCGFEQLDFVKTGEQAYSIQTPKLTYREMRLIDSKIPVASAVKELPIPSSDLDRYQLTYRYFPYFAETEM